MVSPALRLGEHPARYYNWKSHFDGWTKREEEIAHAAYIAGWYHRCNQDPDDCGANTEPDQLDEAIAALPCAHCGTPLFPEGKASTALARQGDPSAFWCSEACATADKGDTLTAGRIACVLIMSIPPPPQTTPTPCQTTDLPPCPSEP